MENQPKKLMTIVLESAAGFALSAFLLRLGVTYLKEIWAALLIIAVIIALAVAGWRLWKHKRNVKW